MPPLFKPSQLVKASNRSSDVRVRASSKRSNNGISFSTWIFLSLLSCLYSNAFAYISEVNPIDASARNGLPTNKRALPKKSRTAQPKGPPAHSLYEVKLSVPVIGSQLFSLKILNANSHAGIARLTITGSILNIHDEVEYSIDDHTGDLCFELSDETEGILRRFKTRLLKASYCPKTDTPTIIVKPPLPKALRLNFRRREVSKYPFDAIV